MNVEATRYHVKRLVRTKRLVELPPADGFNAFRFAVPGTNGRAAAQPPAADTEGDERRARASARA